MPINQILEQPLVNSMRAAYRPIRISVNAQSTSGATVVPPVVYCDVYFRGVYYKTISKTLYSELRLLSTDGQDPAWLIRYDFDIQDLCQEYLKHQLAPIGGGDIVEATNVIADTFCRMRASGYNTVGFIEQEGTIPVQATGRKAATAGTGIQTNTFYVVNATLQHLHNQDLTTHLQTYKTGLWADNSWPLTHRSLAEYKACEKQSDYFPVLYAGNRSIKCFKIHYRYTGESAYRMDQFCMPTPCALINVTNVAATANENDTQSIEFTWDELPINVTAVAIKYRPTGGGDDDWLTHEVPASSPQFIVLPFGKFDFILQTKGDCIATDGPIRTGIGETPNCVAANITEPTAPPAVAMSPYNFELNITGDAPFAVITVAKPAWMTVTRSGTKIILSGTPSLTNVGTSPLFIQIVNCTDKLKVFSQSIPVSAPVTSNNRLNISIIPGGNWTVPNPYDNCYTWRGNLRIVRISTNTQVHYDEWDFHSPTNVQQIETATLTNLEDGNYLFEWNLAVFEACAVVPSTIRFFETFAGSQQKNSTDTKIVSISGGASKNIRFEVEKN